MGMPRKQRAPVAALALVMAVLLAGCGEASVPMPSASTPSAPVPSVSGGAVVPTLPPTGVHVELFQERSDYGPRRIQLSVVNDGTADLAVLGLRLSSPYLATAASPTDFPYTVRGGATVNFPVVLPPAVCGGVPATSDPVVELRYGAAEDARVARVIPRQPFDSLDLVHTNDCRQEAFLSRVTLTPASSIRRAVDPDGKLAALLPITLTPTGKAGRATITAIGGTILLDVQPVRGLPISFGPRSRAVTIVVRATPTRCDPHVVAEDKVGTILPVTVSVGGDTGMFSLTLPAALRNQYLQFVSTACGW